MTRALRQPSRKVPRSPESRPRSPPVDGAPADESKGLSCDSGSLARPVLLQRINGYLVRWVRKKYKRLRTFRKAHEAWGRIIACAPRIGTQPLALTGRAGTRRSRRGISVPLLSREIVLQVLLEVLDRLPVRSRCPAVGFHLQPGIPYLLFRYLKRLACRYLLAHSISQIVMIAFRKAFSSSLEPLYGCHTMLLACIARPFTSSQNSTRDLDSDSSQFCISRKQSLQPEESPDYPIRRERRWCRPRHRIRRLRERLPQPAGPR
jgi:hypothetical protein